MNWWKDEKEVVKPATKQTQQPRKVTHFYTVQEIAEKLRCNKDYVYDLINRGELGYQPVGQRKLVPDTALEEFLERERLKKGA